MPPPHSLQAEEPALLTSPAAQVSQPLAPAAEMVPAVHSAQALLPLALAKRPAAQGTQAVAVALGEVPARQGRQDVDPTPAEIRPPGQAASARALALADEGGGPLQPRRSDLGAWSVSAEVLQAGTGPPAETPLAGAGPPARG